MTCSALMRATCSAPFGDVCLAHGLSSDFAMYVCPQLCLGKNDGWESECRQRARKAVLCGCATRQQLVTGALPTWET